MPATTVFNQTSIELWTEQLNSSDTYKLALITATLAPTAADALPHFGGTGTTDISTNEVTPGGNYSAGGVTLTTVTVALNAGVAEFKADKVSIAQHASNPTNARYAVIYNDTLASKRCIAFINLDSARDLSAGLFEIRFSSTDGNGVAITITPNA